MCATIQTVKESSGFSLSLRPVKHNRSREKVYKGLLFIFKSLEQELNLIARYLLNF